jgi:hypothetical protein
VMHRGGSVTPAPIAAGERARSGGEASLVDDKYSG